MRKGVILEIKKKYLVMLTPDGEFVKGMKPHDHLYIGQEISFDPYLKKLHFPLVLTPAKIGSLAVVSIMILCALLFNFTNQNKAYAYVSIDANPSVELVLNKNLQVIGAKALNADGQKVLAKVDVEGKQDFEDIAKQVLLTSNSLGFIDLNSKVVIASVLKDENNKQRLEKKVQDLAPVAKSVNADLKVVNASMDERKNALKSGVSTGKYVMEKEMKKNIEKENTLKNQTQPPKQNVDIPKNKQNEIIHKEKEPVQKNIQYKQIIPDRNYGQQKKIERIQENKRKMEEKKGTKNHHWSNHHDNGNHGNYGNHKNNGNHGNNNRWHKDNGNHYGHQKHKNNGNHGEKNQEQKRKGK
ncbi:hypothetical protein AN964_15930 [Heyndrickxia shackletonii]|uniref:RsgI N-terminal anti-sigma domain-containing protein n=1 Tax=Heyndrickxia shackletonii TaxID=157838 RepID=A0A0Q3WYP4_9BACI|nr:anti-sigma factor domain-containing protein [Heyndrickxia shackletonii]KQL54851.1 hypothetical protein AN964_15930 [Heyndrickxia shackletonii]MBB2479561.1 anti-sigma factor domain-containing protein [Bacillus sp. APMAM]NEY99499.1 anti-sigma factor domain-containing protein [Heyndrickxia shackletonii]RTZ57404.1 anti-sigma factor domain-containing protein [Bacillus sp. SAJ1]